MLDSPYKFLDHYESGDRAIFFGRERETRILMADVLVSRLVVLFARTGTGKTSLINAGVRPRLEERGYRTFYIRVREDPVASARAELEKQLDTRLTSNTLAELVHETAGRLKESIVLFFDQFEEFFIYVRPDSERGRRFISDVAALSIGPRADAHVVFSMREEFFHEMNEFRGEIPSIFHSDSNLRLYWFDEDQAREAIVEPALVFGTRIDRDLEDQLILDLKDQHDRIEPAQLQIVCDTLWRETETWRKTGENRITREHYNNLGRKESSETIAVQLLYRRLEEMFDRLSSKTQLHILYAVLPKLRTPWNTKYVRDVLGLVTELTSDDVYLPDLVRAPEELGNLVEQLKTDDRLLRDVIDQLAGVRFLRTGIRDNLEIIELSHDYLVPALEPLQQRVKAMALRRQIQEALERREAEVRRIASVGGPAPHPASLSTLLTAEEREALFMARTELEVISDGAALLNELTQEEAEFLFLAALEHGIDLETWFHKAIANGVQAWKLLQELIESADWQGDQVRNALQLLGEVKGTRALQLLEIALRRPELSPAALEVLGRLRTGEALSLLEKYLKDEAQADRVIDVLRRMRTADSVRLLGTAARSGGLVGLKAALTLDRVATARREPDEISRQAGAALDGLLRTQAESFFLLSLSSGQDMDFWFEKALEKGMDAWGVLRDMIISRDAPRERVDHAVRLLSTLKGPRAEGLLRLASERLEPSGLARSALEDRTQRQRKRRSWEEIGASLPKDPWPDLPWEILIHAIQKGQCLPILGSGFSYGVLPDRSEMAQELARIYDYPYKDEDDLAKVAQFVSMEKGDNLFLKERIRKIMRSHEFDSVGLHRLVADLPLPLYATTNYDDLLTRALADSGRSPRRSYCHWAKWLAKESESDFEIPASQSSPVVFHFFGTAELPESMVLTEDEYLDFLVNVREPSAIPRSVQVALTRSSLLFLGFQADGSELRIVLRAIQTFLQKSLSRANQLVLLPPEEYFNEGSMRSLRATESYFDRLGSRIYWGTARDFLLQLQRRWREI